MSHKDWGCQVEEAGMETPGVPGSPEGGVPLAEQGLVEECLGPFNCVPAVWMSTSLFGEM
jgi:hypothetical protein